MDRNHFWKSLPKAECDFCHEIRPFPMLMPYDRGDPKRMCLFCANKQSSPFWDQIKKEVQEGIFPENPLKAFIKKEKPQV